ncbi:MAG: thiamine phosphate synthase [Dehalococcoidales bacterium]|nr:thiamine phosphate synthase [Dehalococcoidales bacterium]
MGLIARDKLRIIDANLNRLGEGLRVLEEFARFVLNDAVLTQQLKDLRHDLLRMNPEFERKLITARDALRDIGAGRKASGETGKREGAATVAANARRVQEALRVIEELAKDPALGLDAEKYEGARFTLYTIEKDLVLRLCRKDRLAKLSGLYVIIDTALLGGRHHLDVAGKAVRGGAKVIQLRDKHSSRREFFRMAGEISDFCKQHGVLFIVNDSLEVALAVEADGLHIGRDDLPAEIARRLLPADKILGCSARTVEAAMSASAAGADYLGVGAMSATATKDGAEVVGPGRIAEIKRAVDLPVVAIGGISEANIGEVVAAGADAVAVVSAVMLAGDVEEACRRLAALIQEKGHDG